MKVKSSEFKDLYPKKFAKLTGAMCKKNIRMFYYTLLWKSFSWFLKDHVTLKTGVMMLKCYAEMNNITAF